MLTLSDHAQMHSEVGHILLSSHWGLPEQGTHNHQRPQAFQDLTAYRQLPIHSCNNFECIFSYHRILLNLSSNIRFAHNGRLLSTWYLNEVSIPRAITKRFHCPVRGTIVSIKLRQCSSAGMIWERNEWSFFGLQWNQVNNFFIYNLHPIIL